MTHFVDGHEFSELLRCPKCHKQLWQNLNNFDCITPHCPIDSITVKIWKGKK